MCSSGSSHAILHMATFKGFFFFHAGFNLICCPGIEEAQHIIELYSVSYRERDGLKNRVCVYLYIHIYTVYKNENVLYGRSDVIPQYCVTISKLRQFETRIKLIFSKQTKRGIGVILYNHFWKMLCIMLTPRWSDYMPVLKFDCPDFLHISFLKLSFTAKKGQK